MLAFAFAAAAEPAAPGLPPPPVPAAAAAPAGFSGGGTALRTPPFFHLFRRYAMWFPSSCLPDPDDADVSTIGGNSAQLRPSSSWNAVTFSMALLRFPGRTLRFLSILVNTLVSEVIRWGKIGLRSGRGDGVQSERRGDQRAQRSLNEGSTLGLTLALEARRRAGCEKK